MNVVLRLTEAAAKFLWVGGWWGVCKVIFVSNPTAVLRLCCCWSCDSLAGACIEFVNKVCTMTGQCGHGRSGERMVAST